MTPKQLNSWIIWYNKTIAQCKNCGDKCILFKGGKSDR